MKKIWRTIRQLWYGLFVGLKGADDSIMHPDNNSIPGNAIIQEVNDHRVSKALLKGEVTQEVEELRYRTYLVDREAKQYEYIAPTLAFKRDKQDNKFISFENSDNLEIITIQPNEVDITGLTDDLKDIDFTKAQIIGKDEDVLLNVGKFKTKKQYIIKINRSFVSRFKLEEYTKRLVVKRLDKTHAILDFYVSKYPDDKDLKSKGFVREIEKIKDDKMKSDVIDIDEVSFVTSHAYRCVDMLEYQFDNIRYRETVEFDGHYIIRFKARIVKDGVDLTDKFYSKTMDEKYKNKVKKEVVLNIFGTQNIDKYVCESCGKEVYYDPEEMDNTMISRPRDIDEEYIESSNNTEYMDMQITEQTYGKVLCKDCLKKYIKEKYN